MQEQRGNFLLQVLLALTLVFAFMPFIANRLASRDMSAKMYAAKTSVETLHNAARIYARENKDTFVCASENNPTTYSDTTTTRLTKLLEPYGLPKGFITTTALGQDISLQIVHKMRASPCNDTENKTVVDIVVSRGDLSQYQLAELARMIGFFARAEGDIIRVNVPVDVIYSDIVRRRETNEQIGFLTDLEMGGCECVNADDVFPDCTQTCAYHSINNVNVLHAERGDLKRAQITMLTLLGDGLGANENEIEKIKAGTFIFRDAGNMVALNVSGNITVDHATLNTIGTYVKPGILEEGVQYEDEYYENYELVVNGNGELQKDFGFYVKELDEQKIFGSFTAKAEEGVITDLTVGNFDFPGGGISGFDTLVAQNINVYPTQKPESMATPGADKEWGLSASDIFVPAVEIYDQDISGNNEPDINRRVAVISPAGASEFEDVRLVVLDQYNTEGAFMGSLRIPISPAKKASTNCRALMNDLFDGFSETDPDSLYDNLSLLQNILCQYIYLARLERYLNCYSCCHETECEDNYACGNLCAIIDGDESPWF